MFEQIDAGKLRSAIAQCKSALDSSMESKILSEISNESKWKCNSQKTLIKGINDLIKYYDKLKAELESCSVLADYVEQYQAYQAENKSLNGKIKKLKSERDDKFKNSDESESDNALDVYNSYSKKIDKYKSKVNSNINSMESLQKKASAFLGK